MDEGDVGWIDIAAHHSTITRSRRIYNFLSTNKHWMIRVLCLIVVIVESLIPR
jgi:hypothetical protein